MSELLATTADGAPRRTDRNEAAERPVLVVALAAGEPERVGEVLPVPSEGAAVLGRGGDALVRQRPGVVTASGPLTSPRVSRRQLQVRALGDGRLHVENVGRLGLSVRGAPAGDAVVAPGDVLRFEDELVLVCVLRPAELPAARAPADFPWGRADADGLVGESPAAWALRDRLAFVGPRRGDVLLRGGIGVGKEFAARAIHRLSGATGALGEATVYLKEIAGLPPDAAPPEGRRLVAGTAGEVDAIAPALRARFRHVVTLPSLEERREDVPLLAADLLRRALADDADLAGRFADGGEPRLTAGLVEALLTRPLPLQLRDLDAFLWQALATSRGDRVDVPPEARLAPRPAAPDAPALTAREREVVELLARGATYQLVADALGIALGTVQAYVKTVYRKLDASTKAEAVAEALRRGVI